MNTSHDNLPLLPLTSGVLLPGMVFTMALESDEAVAAVEAAEAADGNLVIVPFIDGRYASVGTVAEVTERGQLPGGMAAVAVRGVERARLGTAVPGTGRALWVEVELIGGDDGEAPEEAVELAREYRAVVENILVSRGAGRLAGAAPRRRRARAGRRHRRLLPRPDPGAEGARCSRPSTWSTVCAWSSAGPVRCWPTSRYVSASRPTSRRGWRQTQREFLLRRQLEAIRKELGDDAGAEAGPDDYRSRVAAERTFPSTSPPPSIARSASWSGPRSRVPSTAGSGRGWTRSWSSRGAWSPTTASTSTRRRGSSTRTTTACPT